MEGLDRSGPVRTMVRAIELHSLGRKDGCQGWRWMERYHAYSEHARYIWKGDYREVAEPKRLVFALKNPDNPEDPNREIVTVTFEKLGGKTRVVFSQAGNLPPEQYNKGLKEGWNAFFDRLDTLVKRMKLEGPSGRDGNTVQDH